MVADNYANGAENGNCTWESVGETEHYRCVALQQTIGATRKTWTWKRGSLSQHIISIWVSPSAFHNMHISCWPLGDLDHVDADCPPIWVCDKGYPHPMSTNSCLLFVTINVCIYTDGCSTPCSVSVTVIFIYWNSTYSRGLLFKVPSQHTRE